MISSNNKPMSADCPSISTIIPSKGLYMPMTIRSAFGFIALIASTALIDSIQWRTTTYASFSIIASVTNGISPASAVRDANNFATTARTSCFSDSVRYCSQLTGSPPRSSKITFLSAVESRLYVMISASAIASRFAST